MGILSQAYKDHPLEHQHITPIDFNSIKQIPQSHAWVQSNDEPKTTLDHNKNNQELGFIPIISKIDLEDPTILELLFNACETWGVFQITNHGISHELLDKIESQAKRLFSLPLEEKLKVIRSPEGATGYGSPRITPFFSKLMWSEGFTIMGDSLVHHAKELWPYDYLEFCDVMDEYQAKMKGLAAKLMGLILKSLKIPAINWANQDPGHDPNNICTALQLNSYPTCPDPAQTMGLAPHTDTFLFTILHQSGNANGLQVFKDGPGWVSVDPDPDALVVNVGDLLHILSNARFPSVVHRAVVNNEIQRISFAYFYGPPLDFRVSPFVDYPGCEGPLFRSLEVKEYVGIKAKHLDLALSYVRT